MKIQPRQHLLEIWRATVLSSYDAETDSWRWGGRNPSNSISDAEQLLCLMLPANEVSSFALDDPNNADEEVLRALSVLGDSRDVPRRLVKFLTEYFQQYSTEDGTPTFPGGVNFLAPPGQQPTPEQLDLDVVESFAVSITLTLSALGFARVYKKELTRPEPQRELEQLERLAARRLSAAMVGLVRSFTVNVFGPDTPVGQVLIRTTNQKGLARRHAVDGLIEELRDTAAGLRDLTEGLEQIDPTDRLFECGWSWGVTKGSPPVGIAKDAASQRDGHAPDLPYLYFTVVAMDSIPELFSDRTRELALLNDEQQGLATLLRGRFDLTQKYWATIASFGGGRRWPLEDIPWRTGDGEESDFFSLLVTSIVVRDLAGRRDTDVDLARLGQVLGELANRGRVTRRALAKNDPAVDLHNPGVYVRLDGTEALGPELRWVGTDFAPLLLQRVMSIANLVNDVPSRERLLELADEIWDHLAKRRIETGPSRHLWDQPANAFSTLDHRFDRPSWHHTVRTVQSLILAAKLASKNPLRSDNVRSFAIALLAEAQHLLDHQLLTGSGEASLPMRRRIGLAGQRLQRVRTDVLPERPGSAVAVLLTVLSELDSLAAAVADEIEEL